MPALYNHLGFITDAHVVSVTGRGGHTVEALPVDQVIDICRRYQMVNLLDRLPGVKP